MPSPSFFILIRPILVMSGALALAACGSYGDDESNGSFANDAGTNMTAVNGAAAAPGGAVAVLANAEAEPVGEARFIQEDGAIRVELTASGLAPGKHGAHVHMTGRCDPPDFKSAGGHWNPTDKQHGLENPQGAHQGDLPNLDIGPDGTGKLSYTIEGATMEGGDNPLLDTDGAAMVIHAGPDDMKSDPAGNSGGRIACGVIVRS